MATDQQRLLLEEALNWARKALVTLEAEDIRSAADTSRALEHEQRLKTVRSTMNEIVDRLLRPHHDRSQTTIH